MSRGNVRPGSRAVTAINNPEFNIQPSPLALRPENGPILITQKVISYYQNLLDDISDDVSKYSIAEFSEAYERLGLVQFHYGSYRDAIANLTKAQEGRRKLPLSRHNVRMAICIALASYRIGDLEKSEKTLIPVPALATKLGCPDLAISAYGNLAMIYLANAKSKDAIDSAKKGLDLAMQQMPQKPVSSGSLASSVASESQSTLQTEEQSTPPAVLDLARILLTIYIKTNEFSKAENLLFEYIFPEREKQLLMLGINFACGRFKEVARILEDINETAAGIGRCDETKEVSPAESAALNGDDDGDGRGALPQALSRPDPSVLLSAHVPFNRAVLASRRSDLITTKDLLHTTLERIDTYMHDADTEGREDGDALGFFLDSEVNVSPDVRSSERSLQPLVMQSHVMAVKAEVELLLTDFSVGLLVQSGSLIAGITTTPAPPVSENEDGSTSIVSGSVSINSAQTPGSAVGAPPQTPIDAPVPSLDEVERVSVDLQQERILEQVRRATDFLSNSTQILIQSPFGRRNDRIAPTAISERKDEEQEEAVAAPMSAVESIGLFDTQASVNRASLYVSMLSALDNVESYREIARQARQSLRTIYGINLSDRGTLAIGQSANKAQDMTSKLYCPSKHDVLTLTADLMPLLGHSGRNDISLWAQWALSSSGGFGLGCMGSSFFFPETKKEEDKKSSQQSDKTAAALYPSPNQLARPSEALLKEIKGRIYEVEAGMGNKFDGAESQYKPGDKESRVLLNALLAKVCFQLNLRRDCELAVETMEILTGDMKNFTQNLDYVYIAMARRFRYDLEEMKVPSGSSIEGQASKLLGLLGHAKTYYSAVEKTSDIHLQRDALKKMMNIYSDFSSLSYPDAPPAGYVTPPGETYPPQQGTWEMLSSFAAAEIAEKEKTDPIWLRQFGRVRASTTFQKYKKVLSDHTALRGRVADVGKEGEAEDKSVGGPLRE